jgi:proteasome accessory factor B
MPAFPDKTQRWLDLIAFLAGRRFTVTAEEIMTGVPGYLPRGDVDDKQWESARRKFERDKDELRRLGIPIEARRQRDSVTFEELDGYRLADTDFYLPYLKLVQEEHSARRDGEGAGARHAQRPTGKSSARTVELQAHEIAPALVGLRRLADVPAFPLAREARSAFRKLTFDLDPTLADDAPVLFASPAREVSLSAVLRDLSDALLRRKRVSFSYRGMYRDDVTQRTVRPYGLLYQHAHWYLIAHDEGRGAVRVFRVGRMERVEVSSRSPNTADYQIPEGFDVSEYVDRDPWALGGDPAEAIETRVRFTFPRALWAERNQQGELLTQHPDGSATRVFRVLQPEPFVRWLLSMEGDAAVEEPPELRQLVQETARKVAALYGGEAGRG